MSRARRYQFTLSNYTEADVEHLKTQEESSFIIFGKEVAPTTGTPHLQGYVEFKNPISMKRVKAIFDNDKVHLEPARGNSDQNIVYCSKGGDIFQKGTATVQQGRRTDIHIAKEIMFEGGNMLDVIKNTNSLTALIYAEKMQKYLPLTDEFHKKTVYWLYGEAGEGKTKLAFDRMREISENRAYYRGHTAQWFDGYDGQKVVIFDDLRAGNFPFVTLLQLLDGYATRVPVKGSYLIFKAETIIITTNGLPEEVYAGQKEESIKQLYRRITKIEKFGGNTDAKPFNFPGKEEI